MLCCRLGDETARPLTAAGFRALSLLVRASQKPDEDGRELTAEDIQKLGYGKEEALRIAGLLSREERLSQYLAAAEKLGVTAVTRAGEAYPKRLAKALRMAAPVVLFCRGDLSLLEKPCVSLVGSRELREPGRRFAAAVGRMAAENGLTLVTGGAKGADAAGQDACLRAGGSAIVFTPGSLEAPVPDRCLYLTEGGFEYPFSAPRALARNRLIHAMSEHTFAAQCAYGAGGTWQGCTENLRRGWSRVLVYDDGSEAVKALLARGAEAVAEPRVPPEKQLTF
jgi:DNA processing protein